MTSLNKIIPLKHIKQSKALQGVECEKRWYHMMNGEWYIQRPEYQGASNDIHGNYPAPSIADVIDSAESLFGLKEICSSCKCEKIDKNSGCNSCGNIFTEPKAHLISLKVLEMCQQDKSINEISEYIIKSIKE